MLQDLRVLNLYRKIRAEIVKLKCSFIFTMSVFARD